jgi:hypothetical protein
MKDVLYSIPYQNLILFAEWFLHVFACDQYLWLEPKHVANYVLMIIYMLCLTE